MIRSGLERSALKRVSAICTVAIASLVFVVLAGSASAAKGEYAPFKYCPLANPATFDCIFSETTGGEVKVGNTAVPIKTPIQLQGGIRNPNESANAELIGAEGTSTLSKSPQTVPGGLLGILAPEFLPKFLQELFNEFINKGPTGVTATTELVGTPEVHFFNFVFETGVATYLPVRVKLNNSFLGESCYVGSKKNPVKLALTTGETTPPKGVKPLHGSAGTISENKAETIVFAKGFSLVENNFAAPGAEGCGGIFSLLVDIAVNAKLGLPSEAGANTAILKGNQEITTAEEVRAHP